MKGLVNSGRFELKAVADWSETARKEIEAMYPGVRTFATHREMFEACPTDVVCVSTWPPTHLEVTQDALALPLKGILVEKPLGDVHVDGQKILDLIREKRLPVAVPHGLLVLPHSRAILDLVHGGGIGDLKLVSIECSGWDIINAGIHWLNFFVALTKNEPVVSVMAMCDAETHTFRDGMQVETEAVTYVQTESGVRAVMHTGDYVRSSHEEKKGVLFRLVGTEGTVEFYGWEPRYRVLNAEFPEGKMVEVDAEGAASHGLHLLKLADQMDERVADYSIAKSSLAALELCEAAYLSARHGCRVTLPLAEFVVPGTVDWDPGRPYCGEGGGRNGRTLPKVD